MGETKHLRLAVELRRWVGVTKVIYGPLTRSYLSPAMPCARGEEAVCTRFRRWIVSSVSKRGRKSEEKISVDKLDSAVLCVYSICSGFLDEGKATGKKNEFTARNDSKMFSFIAPFILRY